MESEVVGPQRYNCSVNIGYARTSTTDQLHSLETQRQVLEQHGCERVYVETASGGRRYGDRPQLAALIDNLRPGDCVYVTRLDRLTRSLQDLTRLLDVIETANVGLVSIAEGLDLRSSSPTKQLLTNLLISVAQFERSLIRERTLAGLAASTKRPGPKPKLNRNAIVQAKRLLSSGESTAADVAAALGVSRSTLYRALAVLTGDVGQS